ncbi:ankyrin repeat domain-containing protein 13D isoform X2 [Pseudoliparis swirei]|uniref:ankyrin repeat domain-containing protein 13D isoform X2 n=1 Tax=Pseudoliparis swirei TaxID=2059687 RepID=UPI0024BE279E|nr:ankyrin repeat domain-containing protein 13D isoform X2 [Pseudoliparis swirei]
MAREAFPLHVLVWNNQYLELELELQKDEDVERLDPRGRTPLQLAVCLGHLESTRVLLRRSADTTRNNAQGWTILQEAVSTGDPELVQLVLQYRDFKRATERLAGIPELLSKLRRAQDFYVEMKWEFTSWVPLVSKVCPSDVYRVWKSGSCLRVDTTLLGFEHMTWLKGRRSYIFKGEDEGAVVMEVDHEKQVVYTEPLVLSPRDAPSLLAAMQPSQENTAQRLTTPIVSTHLNTRNIAFERNKSGIWGWRSEKSEAVSGYEAKVYSAANVELVTRSRTEHLSDQDKSRSKGSKTPLQSFLGISEQHAAPNGSNVSQCASPHNPTAITADEYFNPEFNLNSRDIGRPVELSSKVQRFKATLWLSESHPLSLAEQVTPIIDLMAISNAHFAKLRDFITLRLPPGFPVKIEIPLFHVLNARVTFSNLCGCDEPVSSVTVHTPEGSEEAGQAPPPFHCEVDPSVFEPPADYTTLGPGRSEPMRDEDDNLLQFAIQQSLLDAGTESEQVTIWEALTNSRPVPPSPLFEEDPQVERALQESLTISLGSAEGDDTAAPDQPAAVSPSDPTPTANSPLSYSTVTNPRLSGHFGVASSFDEQLRIAMEMSCREHEEIDRKQKEEEDELDRILQLSLTEK